MTAARPILVVDDDQDIRDVIEMALHSQGYAVETASDGVEAMERLSHGLRPSLILLDLMMPRMNGGEMLDEVRNDAELAGIPVVLLSGDNTIVAKAEQLQSDGYLIKPIGLAALTHTVEHFAGPA